MANIQHANILRVIDLVHEQEIAYIITELCECTLYDEMKKKNFKFSVQESIMIIHQIAKGVKKLHDMNIAHRDIKPENVLVQTENKK